MEGLTQEQIKEAYECAQSNNHDSLSELLMELMVLHDMTVQPKLIPRGEGNNLPEKKHVPAYYDVLDGLDQGGESPQGLFTCMRKENSQITELKVVFIFPSW